jgi:hypothetical protein
MNGSDYRSSYQWATECYRGVKPADRVSQGVRHAPLSVGEPGKRRLNAKYLQGLIDQGVRPSHALACAVALQRASARIAKAPEGRQRERAARASNALLARLVRWLCS